MKQARRFFALFFLLALIQPSLFAHATTDTNSNVKNVAVIYCGWRVNGEFTIVTQGSGVLIGDHTVLTNAHVVTDPDDHVRHLDWCVGGVAENSYTAPEITFELRPTDFYRYDEYFDYAFMDTYNEDGSPYTFNSYAAVANADSMVLNEPITVMGYPASGGNTLTTTTGNIVGYVGTNWFKTNATVDEGSSGGAGFDSNGNLFGIPTAVSSGNYASFTFLQNINAIAEDAFGSTLAVRDYDTLYQSDNVFCLYDNCYQFAEDESSWTQNVVADDTTTEPIGDAINSVNGDSATTDSTTDTTTEDTSAQTDEPLTYTVPDHARYDASRHKASFDTRMKGYILLQTEEHGEAWYVNVNDGMRYYMRDGAIAYQMLRSFGLGITDADLLKIPAVETVEEMRTAKSVCSTNPTAKRLRGQILLQVQQHGEAWYIHPDTCRRVYMKDGDVAYSTMRFLSLGITDEDLAKLPYSSTLIIK